MAYKKGAKLTKCELVNKILKLTNDFTNVKLWNMRRHTLVEILKDYERKN